MRGFIKVAVGLLLAAAIGFSLWYFRPWSAYSPSQVAELQNSENYVEVFQNLDKYLPVRTISKSDTPRELPENPRPIITSYRFKGEEKQLADFLTDSQSAGLVVLKDGAIVHQSYRQGADDTTRHTSWSVAKSVVATSLFVALQEGKIASLDDKAEKYAPQYKGSAFGDTSLRSLLAMATGIEFEENYSDPKSDISRFFFDSFVFQKDVDRLLLPYKRTRREYTDFTYISPNSQVLSAVLRGAYGTSLNEVVTRNVWHPAGMEADALWAMHREGDKGVEMGYCCLNATSRDYARFGQFWLEAVWNQGVGKDVLPANVKNLVMMPASDKHEPNGKRYSGRGYSHHFWLPPSGDGESQGNEFFAAGVYGQYVWVDAARGVVIAHNAADLEWISRSREAFTVFRAITQHYAD